MKSYDIINFGTIVQTYEPRLQLNFKSEYDLVRTVVYRYNDSYYATIEYLNNVEDVQGQTRD